jgi:hypothetical protein
LRFLSDRYQRGLLHGSEIDLGESDLGHQRHFERALATFAIDPIATETPLRGYHRFGRKWTSLRKAALKAAACFVGMIALSFGCIALTPIQFTARFVRFERGDYS